MGRVLRGLFTPVLLLALLAVLWFGTQWGLEQVNIKTPPRIGKTCVMTDVGSKLTPDRVTVRVLNGGERGGYAKRTALYLRAHGFHVVFWNNSDQKVEKPVILGNAADSPEVLLLQQFFAGSVTEGDGRDDHTVDVILSSKDSWVDKPVGSVKVDGPICLPPIDTSTDDELSASATPSATPDEPTQAPTPSPTKTAKKKK